MLPFRRTGRLPPLAALLSVLALFVSTPHPPSALAQEDLYGPQAPTDVAYVRGVNARDQDGLGVRVGERDLETLRFLGATAYVAVEPGSVALVFGDETFVVETALGDFLTVVAGPTVIVVIHDTPLRDTSRGVLALYNLSDRSSLDLVVVDGPTVVEGVAPGEQSAVVVAEAEVGLAAISDQGDRVELTPRLYERGVAHAVFVTTGADGLVIAYEASRLD